MLRLEIQAMVLEYPILWGSPVVTHKYLLYKFFGIETSISLFYSDFLLPTCTKGSMTLPQSFVF